MQVASSYHSMEIRMNEFFILNAVLKFIYKNRGNYFNCLELQIRVCDASASWLEIMFKK